VGGPGSAAAAFLARLDEAAAFLAPLAAADTAGGPAYRVAAEFRANRGREVGADQVAGWGMQVGTERLAPRDSAGTAAGWSPGEVVSLAFRWAEGSPVRPAAAGLPAGARADGATLGFAYGGSWALLRLLRARAAPPRLLTAPPERVAHTLAFAARTAAAPQPAGAAGGPAPGDALLFVRVEVLDPATGRALVLPAFPTAAPPLGAGELP
jgi:type VI secretion system protein ImpL